MKLTNLRSVVLAAGGMCGMAVAPALCRAAGIDDLRLELGSITSDRAERLDDLQVDLTAPKLALDMATVYASDPDPPAAQPTDAGAQPPGSHVPPEGIAPIPRAKGYGQAGSRWWTVGAAYANNLHNASDVNLHLAFSEFIADDLEFAVEAAAWYFHQPGDDTGGVSGSMIFRWHFWHTPDYKWSVFGDAGIGILGAFDDVPDGGTSFDFLPRLGAGFTYAFNDSVDGESRGSRLMVGVRWHHISNGRIEGDTRNPARDSMCVYAAVVFPF